MIVELPQTGTPEPRDPGGTGSSALVDPATGEVLTPGTDDDPTGRPGDRRALSAVQRLAEVTGLNIHSAQTILAEVGLDMTRFPTADHLASWAKLTPRTIQSGPRSRGGKTGKGNPYLKGALGQAAAAAARTQTFLDEKYRRIVKRRGKLKALVAVARSILVIVWHLLSDPTMRFADLGPDYNPGSRITSPPQPIPAPLRYAGKLSRAHSPAIFRSGSSAAPDVGRWLDR